LNQLDYSKGQKKESACIVTRLSHIDLIKNSALITVEKDITSYLPDTFINNESLRREKFFLSELKDWVNSSTKQKRKRDWDS
tara:strand:- start:798 stop:1043 length:246 start_codon:yes stop_codon:yes gene_type:complete